MGGYAAECALKACIAKQTQRFEFPDKKRVNASYTHDLDELLRLASLDKALDQAILLQPGLSVNWDTVRNWSEESRYENVSQQAAEGLVNALDDRRDGIFRWVKRRW